MWLESVDIPTKSLLLICRFNDSGLESVTATYVGSGAGIKWNLSDFIDIDDLQQLLVDRYTELNTLYSEMWSMEGKTKLCCRRAAYEGWWCCKELGPVILAWSLLFILVFIVIHFQIGWPDKV